MPRRRFAQLPANHPGLAFCAICRTFRPDARPRVIGNAVIRTGCCDRCALRLGGRP